MRRFRIKLKTHGAAAPFNHNLRQKGIKYESKIIIHRRAVIIIGSHAPSYSEEKKGVYVNPEQLKGVPPI